MPPTWRLRFAETTEQQKRRKKAESILAAALLRFRRKLQAIAEELARSGDFDAWQSSFMAAIRAAMNAVARAGALLAGHSWPKSLPGGPGADDIKQFQLVIEEEANRQQAFVEGYRKALEAGDKRYTDENGDIDPSKMQNRNGLYGKTLRGLANLAFAFFSPRGSRFTWNLGTNEDHCLECPELAAAWVDVPLSTFTTWPGFGDTPCRMNCDCEVTRSDGIRGFRFDLF